MVAQGKEAGVWNIVPLGPGKVGGCRILGPQIVRGFTAWVQTKRSCVPELDSRNMIRKLDTFATYSSVNLPGPGILNIGMNPAEHF